jgi:glycosyltransferase involved in cell wall biosynthesis
VARVVDEAGCGRSVPPDDADAFTLAVEELVADRSALAAMGARGRAWVERWISPAAVALASERLFEEVGRR